MDTCILRHAFEVIRISSPTVIRFMLKDISFATVENYIVIYKHILPLIKSIKIEYYKENKWHYQLNGIAGKQKE